MNTEDFVTALFCRVDDEMRGTRPHPLSRLHPSEVVTLALLFAMTGRGGRAFYRWVSRDLRHLFPRLPERTRLLRLFAAHERETGRFLAEPTALGVADTFGIELIHPIREGRSERQIGGKGVSNHRWIVGGKLCLLLNQFGRVVAWDFARANTHDSVFNTLVGEFEGRMQVLADSGFHGAGGDPGNLLLCRRGKWNVRMMVETVLSMMTRCCNAKRMAHRTWTHFATKLAFLVAAFNVLVSWNGLAPDENGFVKLSIADLIP